MGWGDPPSLTGNSSTLSARLSVTRWYCTKTAKLQITQITPHDSPGTLFSEAENLGEIPTGSPPTGAGYIGSNDDFSTNLAVSQKRST